MKRKPHFSILEAAVGLCTGYCIFGADHRFFQPEYGDDRLFASLQLCGVGDDRCGLSSYLYVTRLLCLSLEPAEEAPSFVAESAFGLDAGGIFDLLY